MKRSQLLLIGVGIIFGPSVVSGVVVGRSYGLWGGVVTGIIAFVIVLAIAYYWVMRHTKSDKGEKPNG